MSVITLTQSDVSSHATVDRQSLETHNKQEVVPHPLCLEGLCDIVKAAVPIGSHRGIPAAIITPGVRVTLNVTIRRLQRLVVALKRDYNHSHVAIAAVSETRPR
jgi:hypothetical protein